MTAADQPGPAATTTRGVGLIAREVLFGDPTQVAPALSPDGCTLAWLATADGVLNVWIRAVDTPLLHTQVTFEKDRGIEQFMWAADSRRILYLVDPDGAENHHLVGVDLATGVSRTLTPTNGVKAFVVRTSQRRPTEVLVGLNVDSQELHDAYVIDLTTATLQRVWTNPGLVMWVADDDLQIRAGMQPQFDGSMTLSVRDSGESNWRRLVHIGHDDVLTTRPLAFSADGTHLHCLTSVGVNTTQLVSYDLATGTPVLLAFDPVADVTDVFLHPTTAQPRLAMVAQQRMRPLVLDDTIASDVAAISTLGGDFTILGSDTADTTWLVATTHDNRPIRYYTYHRASRTSEFMFSHRPELDHQPLARMEPYTINARDALTLKGYLTFPLGIRRRDLPAVVLVHGGPWHRDHWGFHPEVQWLANRGYVVIQVDFRGSTGHGKKFLNAGDRQWGARMHDDLIDALAYTVDEGWVDPGRVAIYGASYGGYAALIGAAFTPDIFTAAVTLCGPANLNTLIQSIPPYLRPVRAQMVSRIGDPDVEPDFLYGRSPLSKADQIRIPVLIGQGATDVRVPVAEAEQIVEALNAHGVPHQYLLYPDEGHGLVKPHNRLGFYAAAEMFLAQHLGGGCEPPASWVNR